MIRLFIAFGDWLKLNFNVLSGNFISPCYQSILNDTEVRKIYRLEEAKVAGSRISTGLAGRSLFCLTGPIVNILATGQRLRRTLMQVKNIFQVYHIRIIAPQKNGSHDMKQTDSSIIIVRNVCVLTSASMIAYLFVMSHDRQSSEQNNRKLISLHNNGEDDKHAHGFADF